MSKNPAFQFYPSDWTRDLDDQDLEVEGAWIRICCRLWWSETKGSATKPIREWARILRKTEKKTREILEILLSKSISSGSVLDNQNITIISRRMVRDYEISKIRQEVGKLGGNPGLMKIKENLDNQKLSKSASLLSSTSSSKIFIIPDLSEVTNYCQERKNGVDPQKWHDFYSSKGWMIGKNKMKDWKAAVRTWESGVGEGGVKKASW
jgi:hypothetical protein